MQLSNKETFQALSYKIKNKNTTEMAKQSTHEKEICVVKPSKYVQRCGSGGRNLVHTLTTNSVKKHETTESANHKTLYYLFPLIYLLSCCLIILLLWLMRTYFDGPLDS